MAKIKYIKTTNGKIFCPQSPGVKDISKNFSNYPVCIINKLKYGKFKIDYFDRYNCNGFHTIGDNREDIPNTTLILYPNGISEIEYER